MELKRLVDRIVEDGVITEAERLEICRAVAADPDVSQEEREQVSRLTDLIDRGEVRLVGDASQAEG